MRLVLVLEDLLTGGAQVHAVELATRLRARGWSVEAAVLGRQVAPALAERLGGGLHVLDQQGLTRPGEWARLAAAVAALRGDLVVAVNQVAGCVTAAARLSGRLRTPTAAVLHCTGVQGRAGWVRTGGFLACAPRFDAVVLVSERQRAHWRRRGLAARRTEVIRNGVDLDRHRRAGPAERAAAKRALGLDPSVLTLGAVAMFRREKNHLQMLEGLAALRQLGLPVELILVGDGPTRAEVEGRARALEVQGAVRICGEQADVRPYLAAMDVGLLCSTTVETSPLFALELMASGSPMVAPRLGGLEEVIEDAVDGLLFAPADTGALVRQLKRAADPVVRRKLADAAHLKAQAFSVDVMTDRYEAVFRDLAPARAA